jgi:hypothetical protein
MKYVLCLSLLVLASCAGRSPSSTDEIPVMDTSAPTLSAVVCAATPKGEEAQEIPMMASKAKDTATLVRGQALAFHGNYQGYRVKYLTTRGEVECKTCATGVKPKIYSRMVLMQAKKDVSEVQSTKPFDDLTLITLIGQKHTQIQCGYVK